MIFDTLKRHCLFLQRVVVVMKLVLNLVGTPMYEDLKTHFTTLKITGRAKILNYVNLITAKCSEDDVPIHQLKTGPAQNMAAPKTKTTVSKRAKAAAVSTTLNHPQVKLFDF
jgi:hypothetical protein